MKRFFILFTILILNSTFVQAQCNISDVYLYCDQTGVEKCKYDIIMRQALIVNNLQLNEVQKKQMVELFNKYGEDRAIIMNELRGERKVYEELKTNKASLKSKSEQKRKIKKINKKLAAFDKVIVKETKKILTKRQRYKYQVLQNSLF